MLHCVIDFFHFQTMIFHDGTATRSITQSTMTTTTYLSNALAYFSRSLLAISDTWGYPALITGCKYFKQETYLDLD